MLPRNDLLPHGSGIDCNNVAGILTNDSGTDGFRFVILAPVDVGTACDASRPTSSSFLATSSRFSIHASAGKSSAFSEHDIVIGGIGGSDKWSVING